MDALLFDNLTVSRPFERSVCFLGAEEVFDEVKLGFLEEIFLLTVDSSHVLPIDSLSIRRCK